VFAAFSQLGKSPEAEFIRCEVEGFFDGFSPSSIDINNGCICGAIWGLRDGSKGERETDEVAVNRETSLFSGESCVEQIKGDGFMFAAVFVCCSRRIHDGVSCAFMCLGNKDLYIPAQQLSERILYRLGGLNDHDGLPEAPE
jgi:hypothetical protein